MSLQVPISPLTSQYSDSDSYDHQFGDVENDAKSNDILNNLILSVEGHSHEKDQDILSDAGVDSAAANQLFEQIFAQYRANNTINANAIAHASPMAVKHVRSKSSAPDVSPLNKHRSPPAPYETPLSNVVLNADDPPPLNMNESHRNYHPHNHRHADTVATNVYMEHMNNRHNISNDANNMNTFQSHPHNHSHHGSYIPIPPTHRNSKPHAHPPPPMPHNNTYPSPHNSPSIHVSTHSSPNNSIPPSPHFSNIQVPMSPAQTPIFIPQRHFERGVHIESLQVQQHSLLQQHSAPVSPINTHQMQPNHIDYRHPSMQQYYPPQLQHNSHQHSPNISYKPVPHYHQMQHNNHQQSPTNTRQHHPSDPNWSPNRPQSRSRHAHHWNMSPHKQAQSVNYVNNRNNGNTVHIMYNININDTNSVYSGNNRTCDSPIINRNIQQMEMEDNISPFLRQSISPTSSLEEFIAKPPVLPHNDEFIPPSPLPSHQTVLHTSASESFVVEGPARITTTTTGAATDDFIPPSPIPRAYRSRTNHQPPTPHQDANHVQVPVNLNNNAPAPPFLLGDHHYNHPIEDTQDSKERSNTTIWDEDSSSDDDSDAASTSSSASWTTKQKQSALTSWTNTVESAPKNNTEQKQQYTPSHQYCIDAIFNIKKFSQKSDAAISLEEFEASFKKIPETLNEEMEFKPISPTSLTPSSPTSLHSSVGCDPNILQLKEIIWSVTNPNFTGKDRIKIRDVVLLCHPIFTESLDILTLLQKRFLTQEDDISDSLQFQIQTKVTVFLRHWIMHYYYQDFELAADGEMNKVVDSFIDAMRDYFEKRKTNKIFARGDTLPRMIEKTINDQQNKLTERGLDRKCRKRAKANKVLGSDADKDIPTNTKTRKSNDKKFWNEDNKKIAQQLTLLEFEHFKSIQPRECLCQNWKKKDKELRAPNILKNVEFFNNLSNYVAMSIISRKDAKQRSKMIRKWIKIGGELFQLHNFESLAAVQGTLSSTPLYRLKAEWKYVSEKHRNKFKEFTVIYARGKNNTNLRKIIQITPPPMIPYTGIFLQDLFVIEESRTTTKKDGTINFPKLMALHGAVKRIQVLQNTKYTDHFQANNSIQHIIKEGLKRYSHLRSQDVYDLSVTASGLKKKK